MFSSNNKIFALCFVAVIVSNSVVRGEREVGEALGLPDVINTVVNTVVPDVVNTVVNTVVPDVVNTVVPDVVNTVVNTVVPDVVDAVTNTVDAVTGGGVGTPGYGNGVVPADGTDSYTYTAETTTPTSYNTAGTNTGTTTTTGTETGGTSATTQTAYRQLRSVE